MAKTDDISDVQFLLRLPLWLKKELDLEAAKMELSTSEWMRRCLESRKAMMLPEGVYVSRAGRVVRVEEMVLPKKR